MGGNIVKKSKRRVTVMLVAVMVSLLFASTVSATGTTREFWNMTIRAWKGESVLTNRNKQTNNEYSRVKVTSMKSVGKARVGIKGPTYYLGSVVIDNGVNTNNWVRISYTANSGGKGAPAALYNTNYNLNSTTGSMGGSVDYE